MKTSLVFGLSAAIDLIVALVFLGTGSTLIAGILLASAVVIGLMAFLQWRSGR